MNSARYQCVQPALLAVDMPAADGDDGLLVALLHKPQQTNTSK
jgi:hypothetical protein